MTDERKSASSQQFGKRAKPKPLFDSPFRKLKSLIKERSNVPAVPSAKASARISGPPSVANRKPIRTTESTADEEALFRQALDGVRPMGGVRAERIAVEPVVVRSIISEDAEVLAELSDLVSGHGAFELTETVGYLE